MPLAEIADVTVYYEDTGDGPPLVFSHGLLMDHEMFDPQVGALKSEFRCITWDERGHGQTQSSRSPPAPFTFWDSAKDLLGLLDHLGIEHAVLVGMSQGGFLSLRAALLAPERVTALGFIDSHAGREDESLLPGYEAMVHEWMTNGPSDALAEVVASIILGPADHGPWIAKWKAKPPEWVVEPFKTLVGREDLHDRLAEITCPCIVIHGEADAAIPMANSESLCRGLPRCEKIVRIPGAGHASNLSHPEVVTDVLRDFCARHAL
jgi:3-oxoadipate enol-lactonase